MSSMMYLHSFAEEEEDTGLLSSDTLSSSLARKALSSTPITSMSVSQTLERVFDVSLSDIDPSVFSQASQLERTER